MEGPGLYALVGVVVYVGLTLGAARMRKSDAAADFEPGCAYGHVWSLPLGPSVRWTTCLLAVSGRTPGTARYCALYMLSGRTRASARKVIAG